MSERRPLAALCSDDPRWPDVRGWITASRRTVDVRAIDPDVGDATLLGLQVTDRSPMGAIGRCCGGLSVDHGWLRVFGAGPHGLLAWNSDLLGLSAESLPSRRVEPQHPHILVVGADALGGF